jgi:hypothetical protein
MLNWLQPFHARPNWVIPSCSESYSQVIPISIGVFPIGLPLRKMPCLTQRVIAGTPARELSENKVGGSIFIGPQRTLKISLIQGTRSSRKAAPHSKVGSAKARRPAMLVSCSSRKWDGTAIIKFTPTRTRLRLGFVPCYICF